MSYERRVRVRALSAKCARELQAKSGVSISALRSALACSLRELRAFSCSGTEREVRARVTSESAANSYYYTYTNATTYGALLPVALTHSGLYITPM